jgi:hypothetical protein
MISDLFFYLFIFGF